MNPEGSAANVSRGVEIRLSEPVSETFDCIRGDIHLYEIGEIDYTNLMRGLRESVAVLEAREAK